MYVCALVTWWQHEQLTKKGRPYIECGLFPFKKLFVFLMLLVVGGVYMYALGAHACSSGLVGHIILCTYSTCCWQRQRLVKFTSLALTQAWRGSAPPVIPTAIVALCVCYDWPMVSNTAHAVYWPPLPNLDTVFNNIGHRLALFL